MQRLLTWIWRRGVVSNLLAGFFVVLPIVVTVVIMAWFGRYLRALLGPESAIGQALHSIGLRVVTNETVASILGWCIGLGAIWLLGAFVRSTARYRFDTALQSVIARIPVIGSVYRPVVHVVSLLKKDDKSQLKAMRVVFCTFGQEGGSGFLGLRVCPEPFRIDGQDRFLVYLPATPLPMSGGLILTPVGSVQEIDMDVEELLQIYFSMGVLADTVLPGALRATGTAAAPD